MVHCPEWCVPVLYVVNCMKKLIYFILALFCGAVFYSCSTKENTGLTRRVQAIKAKYNTYYNGQVSFIEGVDAQYSGNKDNYSEVIPLYVTGNKGTVTLGKSNFDRTIEKCQKAIKQRSVTKRPEWKSNKPKTPKDKIWLSQKEYNPFLYKAWFLLADAQFHKGEYLEAAATYAYMQRLYFSKPDIVAKARVLEAMCYAELEWFYDAEDVLNRAVRDSFPKKYEYLKASVLADCQIRQKLYEDAIPNLQKAIKKEKKGLQKSRMYFLLGQLYHKTGNRELAYKAFKKVISRNPPYELEFNARIQQTEVMSKGNTKKMIRKLQSMAKNPKNKDFLDQVYYAIGNIYMSQNDTTRAIWAYKDGVEKSTRNGVEKGVVMLRLGQLYYETEDFVKAQECYAGVIGLIDKDRDDFKDIDERSKILDELLPFAQAIELQDSLQELARMDSLERLNVIKKIIEEVKKKEKEEEKKMAASATTNGPGGQQGRNPAANRNNMSGRQQGGQQGVWYFYNPTAVNAGKAEFKKKWGERELGDDWRRNNKTVLGEFGEDSTLLVGSDSLSTDSLGMSAGGDNAELDEEKAKQEEYANDPHRPEYYLKDIPLTEEQMLTSNAALVDGLFNAGIVYKDRMENFPLAERTFLRVINDFPDFESMDETYYNMFQLYSRLGREEEALAYKEKLLTEYPENKHGQQIADPNYEFKARYGKQVEDSLYQLAYAAFNSNDFNTVVQTNDYLATEYPEGENRARLLFLTALSRLEMGERDQFMASLKEIVEKYPKSTVSELAGLYVKGLQEGRLLASGKMEMGSIWERRRGIGVEGDSAMADSTFTVDNNCDFVFVIAYEHDSINENQLLYEMAKYNFTNFTVRNFDLSVQAGDGIDMFQIRTFLNFEESYIYLHRLMNDEEMATKLEGLKMFVISEDNLRLLMRGKSFADYFEFYEQNFERVGSLDLDNSTLDEPEELPEPVDEDEESEYEEEEENWIF